MRYKYRQSSQETAVCVLHQTKTWDAINALIKHNNCLFIVYHLQCIRLIHQDKLLVGVKSFLVIILILILTFKGAICSFGDKKNILIRL